LDAAEEKHTQREEALEGIEEKLKAEDADWHKEEGRLKAALRRVRR
jgi:hypothetical protein